MTARDVLRTALSNLGRRKVRTVLTAVGVWVGILTIVTMVSAGIALQDQVTATVKQLGLETVIVRPELQRDDFGFANSRARVVKPITPAALQQLAALPDVQSIEAGIELPEGVEPILQWQGQEARIPVFDMGGRINRLEAPMPHPPAGERTTQSQTYLEPPPFAENRNPPEWQPRSNTINVRTATEPEPPPFY